MQKGVRRTLVCRHPDLRQIDKLKFVGHSILMKQRNKSDLILETWESLNRSSAGADELLLIQQTLEKELGRDGVESPASIARTLADEGVPLSHPGVLEADSAWREGRINRLFRPEEFSWDSIEEALRSIAKLESLRQQLVSEGDEVGARSLAEYARELRSRLSRSSANSSILAAEVVQWLAIWLQTPDILTNWLALRRKSQDFARKFGS